MTYPDASVAQDLTDNFVGVKLVSKDNIDVARRFQVRWLPTIVVTDQNERIHHSWVGFLPPKWFSMELLFGKAQLAFGQKDFKRSIDLYDRIVAEYAQAERAPESLYWKGVATYRQTNNFADAIPVFKGIVETYPNSIWARKVEALIS